MLYSVKSKEDIEKLEDLASLKNQVEEIRLQEKLSKKIFHENTKKFFETVTDTINNTSEK